MRLLLVFPFIPYPPDNGGRIGYWNTIKYLSRQHAVHVAFLAEDKDREHWDALKKQCASMQALFRVRPSGLIPMVRGLVGYPPGTAGKFWDPRFTAVLQKAIKEESIDLVEFHHLHTAVYRDAAGTLPTVLREHNAEYVIWQRHAQHARRLERLGARWIAPRVRRYEAAVAEKFDRCVVVSSADADHLRRISPRARIEVIPSGVDTEYFFPDGGLPEGSDKMNMVYVGGFDWAPRQHNLRVILEEIVPRIRARLPGVKLHVVGRGIPPYLERLAAQTAGVTLTGGVPDVRPYIRSASVVLNYVEIGSGIALKVLEAMAMRKPVLCNSLACEGIPVTHGKDILVADGPENFACAAASLLENGTLRAAIAESGYRVALARYSWNHLVSEFSNCYAKILEDRVGGRGLTQVGVGSLQ